jgi:hypothetical protein
MTESEKIKECLTDITTWMREPDWTEEASLEWLMDWINRRPIPALAMVAMLMPDAPPAQGSDANG